MHIVTIVMLALGISVGCRSESPSSESSSATNPDKGSPKASATPDTKPKVQPVEDVDAATAARRIADNPDIIVLDIRTPAEFKSGHLKGALNIDYKADDYAEKLDKLDKAKTYLVH